MNLPEAERLAEWASSRLLKPTDASPYPLRGASARWKTGSKWRLILPPVRSKKPPQSRKPLTSQQVFLKTLSLRKAFARAMKQAEELLARSSAADLQRYGLAVHLGETIGAAQRQLVQLADAGVVRAVEGLAFYSFKSANELLELSRRKLSLVQSVARTFPAWPVNYSPHKDDIKELKDLIDRLGVATASAERALGKWSNAPATDQPHRAIVGSYANQIGHTLRTVHRDGILRQVLRHNPNGWPAWVVRLVQLPPLTKASAPDWFDCGWAALKEAAGGSVASIKELRHVGDSNAAYAKRSCTSDKGRTGKKTGRIESQIRARLLEAFVARFGN